MRGPVDSPESSGLTPHKFSTLKLEKGEKIPTPQDDLKRVNNWGLVVAVMATIKPVFEIGLDDIGDHHDFWPGNIFMRKFLRKYSESEQRVAEIFRGLRSNQVRLPKIFHDYLHDVTVIPELPDIDVMVGMIDAEKKTVRFGQSYQTFVEWEEKAHFMELVHAGELEPDPRQTLLTPDKIEARSNERDDELFEYYEELCAIPPKFRLVDPDLPLPQIAEQIGRVTTRNESIFREALATREENAYFAEAA